MFEQLFGSKTRVKLMRLFLENPEKKFFVRELTRLTDSLINSIRRELSNLLDMKLILEQEEVENEDGKKRTLNTKKYYYLNTKNLFQQDLLNLFVKDKLLVEKKFVERIKRVGNIWYLSMGGTFADDDRAATDILVAGDFDREKMIALMNEFETELGRDIRYTVMDATEYQLRSDIEDEFLGKITGNVNNLVIIDNRNKNKKENEEII